MFASSVLMFGRGDEKLAVSRVASLRSTTSLYAEAEVRGVEECGCEEEESEDDGEDGRRVGDSLTNVQIEGWRQEGGSTPQGPHHSNGV